MGEVVDASIDTGDVYHPEDTVARAIRSSLMTGGAGLLFAAVQNTVSKQNVGAFGVFSRFGGTIALFAGMGGTYAFVKTASANLREKQDPYNHAFGGFAAGALIGLRKRTMPSVLGNGFALGAALAVVSYHGSVFGGESTEDIDHTSSKEELRRRFRRPVNELINEVGEGRGIYGPGYPERRKQRIKENYGIDIQEPYYKREPEAAS